jgi:hypothetical protein
MPKAKSSANAEDVDHNYVRMYYEHQYDRIKKNEDQAMNISNIVFTVTAVILTFGFRDKQSFSAILILFLPIVIIIANVTAILYVRENTRWIRAHQLRAKRILQMYTPALFSLDKETSAPPIKATLDRSNTQYLIHTLFIVIALILLTLQLLGKLII